MNQRFDLHHIQRDIIVCLATRSPLTFTELRPPKVPNNTFSYHLKKLIDTGYIERVERGYGLTRKGLKLVAANAGQKRRSAAPAMLTLLYITNDQDELLLFNRNIDPFHGWYGLPGGAVHFGESLDEAAKRELFEKTGIKADNSLTSVGVLDFQYREEGTDDLFTHSVAFLYSYHYSGDPAALNNTHTKFGKLSWSKRNKRYTLPEVAETKKIVEGGIYTKRSVHFAEPSHKAISRKQRDEVS